MIEKTNSSIFTPKASNKEAHKLGHLFTRGYDNRVQENSQICVEGEVETDGKLNDLTTGFCGFFNNPSRGCSRGS